MPNISVILIDDEPKALMALEQLLGNYEQVDIQAKADNVNTAFCLIVEHQPNLIFLDVEMPPKTGFDLINELMAANVKMPNVVFTTAYDKYAIQALKNHAFDYLLKPVEPNELAVTIAKFQNNPTGLSNSQKVVAFEKKERIMIPTMTGIKNVEVSNVVYIQKGASGFDSVKVIYDENESDTIPACYSLKQVAEMVSNSNFYQIDRNTLINLDYLQEIETKSRKCFLKKEGFTVTCSISRGRLKALREQNNL